MNKLLSFLPIPSLATIQTALVTLMLGLLIGGFGAWHVKSKFVQADLTAQVISDAKHAQASTDKSNKVELSNIKTKADIEVHYKTITKELIKYVPQTTAATCKDLNGNAVSNTLSVGAVSMLNTKSTKDSDIQPAGIGDAEIKAPTEVGLRELSEYVIEIKQQYEELATDHDSLVDYNNWYKSPTNQ